MQKQGQGAGTARKQERFFHAMRLGMRVAVRNQSLARFPFWLFDGNCGEGINREVGVVGSPIAAHQAADLEELPEHRRRFFFCDHDRDRVARLDATLALKPAWASSSYCLFGDNESGLRLFAEIVAKQDKARFATGLIVIDPNGWFYRSKLGEGPPVHQLVEIAATFPRLDILLNINAFLFWRLRGLGVDAPPPRAVLASLHRKNWLVGRINVGQSRFLVAIGRNFETGDHQRVGFHRLNSEIGNEIIMWAEGRRQMGFFDGALPNLHGLFGSPDFQGGAVDCGAGCQPSLPMRSIGNGSSSLAEPTGDLSAVELLRRPSQPEADLP